MRKEHVRNIEELTFGNKVSSVNLQYIESKLPELSAEYLFKAFPPIIVENDVITNGNHRVTLLKKYGAKEVRVYG